MPLNVDKAVDWYVRSKALRTELQKLDEAIKARQHSCLNDLRAHLLETKIQSTKTESGFTVYMESQTTPIAADWDAFITWASQQGVVADAVQRRVKAEFVKEYMDQHEGGIPPGLSVFRQKVAKVRKA